MTLAEEFLKLCLCLEWERSRASVLEKWVCRESPNLRAGQTYRTQSLNPGKGQSVNLEEKAGEIGSGTGG